MQGNEKLLEEMRQGKIIKKFYHLIAVCEFIKHLSIFYWLNGLIINSADVLLIAKENKGYSK